jgi:hypothetical protein
MFFVRATNVAAALVLAVAVAGCSELFHDQYLVRSDKIAPSTGDAIATNQLTQMVDPWPRHAARRNIAFDGRVMRSAVERYRTGKVTAPVNATTSSTQYRQAQPVVLSTGGDKQ